MLYFILQPSLEYDDDEDADIGSDAAGLPPALEKLYRNSLSLEQNESVELAARLEQKIQSNAEAPDKMSQSKKERLRRKVRTVAKMQRMFTTMRQQNEAVLKLGGMCP